MSAWREPWTSRAHRWLKRHRTLATSGLTTLLAILVMLAGFLVRLNAEKHKLQEANAALQAANDNLKESNRQIEGCPRGGGAEPATGRRANRGDHGSISARPEIVVYRHDPLYGLIQEVRADQLNRFAKSVPQNEFGEKVRLLRDNQRLWMIGVMQQTGNSAEFRSQLAITRAGFRDYLRKHPADTWGDFNLAKTYIIEAQRRSLTGPGDEAVAKILLDAFDLLERHATLSDPYGRENAFCAVGAVATLSPASTHRTVLSPKPQLSSIAWRGSSPCSTVSTRRRCKRVTRAARTSGICFALPACKRWLVKPCASLAEGPERRYACGGRGLAGNGREMSSGVERASLRSCFRALASGILAEVAIRDKEHAKAWPLMRQACDLMESSLQGIPGQLEETDRRWVLFSEFTLAEVGAEVLRSSDRNDPAAHAKLAAIARDALAALDTCAKAELLVPAAQRDPRVAKDAPDILEKLRCIRPNSARTGRNDRSNRSSVRRARSRAEHVTHRRPSLRKEAKPCQNAGKVASFSMSNIHSRRMGFHGRS